MAEPRVGFLEEQGMGEVPVAAAAGNMVAIAHIELVTPFPFPVVFAKLLLIAIFLCCQIKILRG
jgi:hypothetical protein